MADGYSRKDLLGNIEHFDKDGHKIGESRPNILGGYSNYDADGRKTGHSDERIFGGGYIHYDNNGHRIGSSDEGLFGDYTNRDASGRVTGHTERSVLDVVDDDEVRATGSWYGSSYYAGKTKSERDRDYNSNDDSGQHFKMNWWLWALLIIGILQIIHQSMH